MNKKESKLLLGAHMSIAGGFEKAIERGASIGCTAIQIFTKSGRQWSAKPISTDEAIAFQQAKKLFNLDHIIAHASYLINLASPDDQFTKKSIDALIIELERCDQLFIKHLVLHPGSSLDSNQNESLIRIAHNIDKALDAVPGETTILIEIMAGQGSSVGHSFDQLATILDLIKSKERVGVCFDTAHAFAAGYQFNTAESYESMWEQFDKTIGIDRLKAIHINDSKKECGSRVDRHDHIGKGKIGIEAFRLLFNDSRFFNVPKILETPKATLHDDEVNMQLLKELISV